MSDPGGSPTPPEANGYLNPNIVQLTDYNEKTLNFTLPPGCQPAFK